MNKYMCGVPKLLEGESILTIDNITRQNVIYPDNDGIIYLKHMLYVYLLLENNINFLVGRFHEC